MPQAQVIADEEKPVVSNRRRRSRPTGSLPSFRHLTKIVDSAKKRTKSGKQRVKSGNQGITKLSSSKITKAFNQAIKQNIARKQKEGVPIARYDPELKRAYLENADGTREYV